MDKKIFSFAVFLILFMLTLVGTVYGSENNQTNSNFSKNTYFQNYNMINNVIFESKTSNINETHNNIINSNSKIKKISKSHSIFKQGTRIKLNVVTDKSIKSVQGSIKSKGYYKFTKCKNGVWCCNLNTKGFKSGNYKFNVKAIDSKSKIYKKSTILTTDNIPPKIFSVSINVKAIVAGNPFIINTVADNSTKKVIASIRGKKYTLKSSNSTNWVLNTSIGYKNIGKIGITVYVYDSIGNFAKKISYLKSTPRYFYWEDYWSYGLLVNKPVKVFYPNPINAYQKSVKILSKYATVYEGLAEDNNILGVTYKDVYGKYIKYTVIIAGKDPFIVYHELAHVLHWGWSEYKCDWYAYNRTGYWIM